jgi:hypothetical protein
LMKELIERVKRWILSLENSVVNMFLKH